MPAGGRGYPSRGFSFLSCSLLCTLFMVVSRAARESVLPRELELEEFAG